MNRQQTGSKQFFQTTNDNTTTTARQRSPLHCAIAQQQPTPNDEGIQNPCAGARLFAHTMTVNIAQLLNHYTTDS